MSKTFIGNTNLHMNLYQVMYENYIKNNQFK